MSTEKWKLNLSAVISIIAVVMLATAAGLFLMGRLPYCECGYIKLWHGQTVSSENSQHLFDPYTFSHIIHGLGFYLLLWLVARRLPTGQRLIIAVMLESLWEIMENTDFVINRYRAVTISLDYYGDSIINSIGDILAAIVGFLFAGRFSVWASVALFVLIEICLLIWIRDSLILNLIMLLYPVEAIKIWQGS